MVLIFPVRVILFSEAMYGALGVSEENVSTEMTVTGDLVRRVVSTRCMCDPLKRCR